MRRWLTRSAFAILAGVTIASCSEQSLNPINEKSPVQASLMAGPTTVRISQVYGGGGSTSTSPVPSYKYDYVELFNYGAQDVDLSGWRLQYASSTGVFNGQATQNVVFAANTTIPAGKYFLVRLGAASNFTGQDIPVFDASGTIAMAAGAGKVLLTTATTSYLTSCPEDANVIDKLGYGGFTCAAGQGATWNAATTTLTTTTALFRKDGGCATAAPLYEVLTPGPRSLASAGKSCGGQTVASVRIVSPPTSVNLNTPTSFTAEALDAQNTIIPNINFAWTASPNGFATFSNNVLTATAAGTIQVRATASGVASPAVTVVINAPEVNSVTVSPLEATVYKTKTQQFTAQAFDILGNPITGVTFSWSTSSAGGEANVSSTGLATGTQPGDVTIIATSPNGKTGNGTLHVLPPPPPPPPLVITEIMANPAKVADASGEWFEVYNPTASSVDLYQYKIVSSTGAPPNLVTESHQIATHLTIGSKQFVVFALNGNTVTNGGITANYVYSGITLSNGNVNEYLELQDPTDQTVDRVNWNSYDANTTNGQSLAVIDPDFDNLDVTGSNWEATAKDPSFLIGGVAGNDYGTPGSGDYGTHGPVVTVSVSPNPAYMSTTGTLTLRATMKDASGASVRSPVTWTTSNAAVMNLNATTGVAQGVAQGDATVTATAANGVQGSTLVHVLAPGTPAYIEIQLDASVPAGFTKRAFFTLKDADGNSISTSQTVTWSTSDNNLATIDDNRYIDAKQPGVVQIIATSGVATGSKSYTILPSSVPTSAIYRDHVGFGTPFDADNSDDFIVTKQQFVASWNQFRGGPNWVSWNLNASQFGAGLRCDCFTTDPIAPGTPVTDQDYVGSGYSRGHMVQSESRTSTDQENATTFYFTNILPQAQASNGGPWLAFENFLNDLARTSGKEVYVVAGGEYVSSPQTLNSLGKVAIPDWTWKVAIALPAGKGLADVKSENDLQIYAVRMPNLLSTAANLGNDWTAYATTVDAIEARTGYNVFDLLSDNIEIAVESGTHAPKAAVNGPFTVNFGTAVNVSGAASTDVDAGQQALLTYSWDFGDGTSATGVSASHTYSKAGTFTIKLTVTDPLGVNSEVTTTARIKDTTPAVITPNVAGTVGTNDWYTSNIDISWTVVDEESGVASKTDCDAIVVSTNTTGRTFTCSAVNGEGLPSSNSVTLKRDATTPTITPVVTGTEGANGWFTSNAHVSWNYPANESNVFPRECAEGDVTADGSFLFSCEVVSGAGLSATKTVTVKRDASAPSLTHDVAGTLGTNGWYRSNVQITWHATDAISGIISPECVELPLATDTNGTTFTCTAENGAGLTTTESFSVKRDASLPVVTFTGNALVYTVADNVVITCSASDVGPSGLASSTCSNVSAPAYTFALGNNTLSASAKDNAGNTGNGSTSFTVGVTAQSLSALVTLWAKNAGQANSLNTKLEHGQINAFINEVEAQRGKAFTNAQADQLIRLAKAL